MKVRKLVLGTFQAHRSSFQRFLQTLFSHHQRKDVSRRSDRVDADHCGEFCGLYMFISTNGCYCCVFKPLLWVNDM